MKIKCIDSIFTHYIKNIEIPGFLTKGKIYNVLHESNDKYTIFDDTNMKASYEKSRFIQVDLHRKNLIEELLK
jgi:uncharacterized protein (DUF1684 family)